MTDRCSGGCCRDFILPFSYDEMQERYQKVLNGDAVGESINNDWLKVPPLLIPLVGPFQEWHATYHHRDRSHEDQYGRPYHHYTCKAFDPETGNCGAYENRPNMCRDFPAYNVKDRCRYKDCTWQGHRLSSPKLRVLQG